MGLLRRIEIRPSEGWPPLEIGPGCILTIGNFDGVHIGHQEILRTAEALARQRGAELVIMTFEPHPEAILHAQTGPQVLTPLGLKLELMARLASGIAIILRDAHELLRQDPQTFMTEIVAKAIRPSTVVEGEDFRFGSQRQGDVQTLIGLGRRLGFDVEIVHARQIRIPGGQDVRVSSTLIRYMLQSGHVADAALALGRPFRLCGMVVAGRGKGRQLGYPTLNMLRPDQIIPAEGVYAGRVLLAESMEGLFLDGPTLPAVFSIGQAITFGQDHPLLIEAHVLEGLSQDLRPRWMAMDFVEHIRAQHRFPSVQALVQQISTDCARARQILGLG